MDYLVYLNYMASIGMCLILKVRGLVNYGHMVRLLVPNFTLIWPKDYKTFFMFNAPEHVMYTLTIVKFGKCYWHFSIISWTNTI